MDDIAKSLSDMNKMISLSSAALTPHVPKSNPAKWTYQRLGEYIEQFEAELDDNQEIGARLVSFGQAITFHIDEVSYYGPDIITFYGANEAGEKLQLIQ
ncbi:MAG: DUF6173 family protein [Rhodomicrobium sp.]